jgi:ubiquitin-like-conjugating enzyme ATG3
MKNIVENMREGGGEVRVESYMTVFLKFVSSIIPRINYDFTQGVEAGK